MVSERFRKNLRRIGMASGQLGFGLGYGVSEGVGCWVGVGCVGGCLSIQDGFGVIRPYMSIVSENLTMRNGWLFGSTLEEHSIQNGFPFRMPSD